MKKQCFKCGRILDITEFYQHKQMKDGHLNKCKDCAKKDVRIRARKCFDKIQAYEKIRSQRPERKLLASVVQKKYRLEHPERVKQNAKVRRAILRGEIIRPKKCSICGKVGKTVAHHTDYTNPLDVIFVCQSCHKKIHSGTLYEKDYEKF